MFLVSFRTRFWLRFAICSVCCCLLFTDVSVLVLLHWEFSYYFVLREIVMLRRYLSIMELRYLCLRVELVLIYLRSWMCVYSAYSLIICYNTFESIIVSAYFPTKIMMNEMIRFNHE